MPQRRKRILVVDDEAHVRSFLHAFLEREGYEVDTAEDGREAFRLANRTDYDLISLDLMMPVWDGLDCIKALEVVHSEVPVLMLSGYLDDKTKVELSKYINVRACLEKPFTLLRYKGAIDTILQEDSKGDQGS